MVFQIGDRVRAIDQYEGRQEIIGEIGTVVATDSVDITVEFDNNIKGHDGKGVGKWGHCWNFPANASFCLQVVFCAIGDTVRVACSESAYTDFSSWIQQNAPEYINRYKKKLKPIKAESYQLIKKAPAAEFFPLNQKMLCLIGEINEPSLVFIIPEEDIYKSDF
ncbi:MAG: hypothetical protein ACI37Z_05005 [Candidatus Gastranaerophilaceae bacterium]